MGFLRRTIVRSFENACGVDIEWIEDRSYVISGRRVPGGVWCAKNVRLANLLKRLNIDLVIDVGANTGQFARDIRRLYAGEIISFEPVSASFSQLQAATASDPRWQAQKIALGSNKGEAVINVSPSSDFSYMLKSGDYLVEHFGQNAKGSVREKVQVDRLDAVLPTLMANVHERRIFLKMDTRATTWKSSREPLRLRTGSSYCSPKSRCCHSTKTCQAGFKRSDITSEQDSTYPECFPLTKSRVVSLKTTA